MRILITGGNGFIGTHLVNRLVCYYPGCQIDIIDNLSNSTLTPERAAFYREHNIVFRTVDVEQLRVSSNHTAMRYRQIYHLASPVGPAGVLKYAGSMGSMILDDSLKMARIALLHGAKLLITSTSEVYGPTEGEFQIEEAPKIVPSKVTVRLEYGVSKLLSEICVLNLQKVHPSLHINFVRPFNIVGPHQKGSAGFVLPRFVQAALKNEPLTVFGDGKQLRTFTHVSDLVNAMLRIMDSKCSGKIYNVGNPKNICSVVDLARQVIDFTGAKSEIQFVDPKTIYGDLYEEAWNKIPSVSSIQQDLGWTWEKSLSDIIKEYVAFVRESETAHAV